MIEYELPTNYEHAKNQILNTIKKHTGTIPSGFDDEYFLTALVKIMNHFTYNRAYMNKTIPAKDVPDNDKFIIKKDEYTLPWLIINRILKNVNFVSSQDNPDPNSTLAGGYSSTVITKNGKTIRTDTPGNITIHTNKIKESAKRLLKGNAQKRIMNTYKDEETYLKMQILRTWIHEILHAISDNGKQIGFEDLNDMKNTKAFNEAMTDNLTSEIAGTNNDIATKHIRNRWKYSYMIKSQTVSGYFIGVNTFNFIRLAAQENIDIPFLVDSNLTRFGTLNKTDIYNTDNPFKKIKNTFLTSLKNIEETLGKKYDLEKDKETPWAKEDYEELIQLQTMLINDINKNKIEKFLKNKEQITPNEFEHLKHSIKHLSQFIIPTFTFKPDDEEKQDLAHNNYFDNKENIIKLIQEHVIDPTSNVMAFIKTLENLEKLEQQLINKNKKNI